MKNGIKELWNSSKRNIFIVCFGILFYVLLQNLPGAMSVIKGIISVIAPLIGGVALAFVVNIPMRFLEKKVLKKIKRKGLMRALSMLISYILVFALVILLFVMIIPRVVDSVTTLFENFGGYMEGFDKWSDDLVSSLKLSAPVAERIQLAINGLLDEIDKFIATVLPSLLKFTLGFANTIITTFLSVIISVYAIFSKEKLCVQARKLILAVFSEERAERILEVCSLTNRLLNRYFMGMLLECTILGTMCFICMQVFSMPYAVLISFIVGITQLAPVIGPWVGGIAGGFIILMIDPPMALWFIIMLLIVQQIDGNIIYPRVVGNAVGLSGIWVMVAVIVGGGLFGVMGVLLSVPVMAVLYILVSRWVNCRLEENDAIV